ncbi:MAG TPA: hypothetical protein VN796_01890 [Acidimicrobiales bacterium]|nr:hypothetical protein [Acidimicrobiales bacterium]
MRAVIVYESMFGCTRLIAESVADGLGRTADVRLVPVADAGPTVLEGADLVVVGGPTHAWGMSRPSTRRGAPLHASDPKSDLVLEPGADSGPGIREWLSSIEPIRTDAAAFDTRIKEPLILTGRASRGISRQLERHGLTVVAPPESFLVDKRDHLVPGEVERARVWGASLTARVDRTDVPSP